MSHPKNSNVPQSSPGLDEEKKVDPRDINTSKNHMNGDEEILMQIPTYNFTLLFCGLVSGIGLGVIIWVFVEQELIIWIGAAVGLLLARILEITLFPQNIVTIWASKNSIEMTQVPTWRETIQNDCDFFVESDIYDFEERYVRSTAIYHFPNTNAITIHERFVNRRSGFKGKLFMNTPVGAAGTIIVSVVASAIWYLRDQNISEQVSLFVIAVVVLVPVLVILGCLVEVELRKRRFLSFNLADETVTSIPLHTIGKIEQTTLGGDFWKLFYTPPAARNYWSRAKLALKLIFGPVLIVYRFCVFVIALTIYNGAFALFFWECIATALVYQAHVQKETKYLEPAMALLWITVLVNIFELWYCWSANGRFDSVTVLGTNRIRKLEMDSDTRIPVDKVKKLFCGFIISLVLVVLSAILVTALTDRVLKEIVIYNFDDAWEDNFEDNRKFIMCENDDEEEETRRMMNFGAPDAFHETVRTAIKSKYSSDYDALCGNDRRYLTLTAAVVFCSIDWVLLLLFAVYWHTNDKYQHDSIYDNTQMVWNEVTKFHIHFVPSKITWIGRVLGRQVEKTFWFYLHPGDAENLGQFLINNVPWYAQLDPRTPLAKELLPRYIDVDTDDQVSHGILPKSITSLVSDLF